MEFETLYDFEHYRAGYIKVDGKWIMPTNPIRNIPIAGSDNFYKVSEGEIDLYSVRDDQNDYRFDIYLTKGAIDTGASFSISGETDNTYLPYRNMIVKKDVVLNITSLDISRGNLISNGQIILKQGKSINISSGKAIIEEFGSIIINENSMVYTSNNGVMEVKGNLIIHKSKVDYIMNHKGIEIKPGAIVKIFGSDEERPYSLSKFCNSLSDPSLDLFSGDLNINGNILRYTCNSLDENVKSLNIFVREGSVSLGDFRQSVIGIPNRTNMPVTNFITSIEVMKGTNLYIGDDLNSWKYPVLYIGSNENYIKPASCIINGKVIVDGKDSKLQIYGNGLIKIAEGASLILKNKSTLERFTLEEDESHGPSIYIDGTIIVDSMDQFTGFTAEDFQFGVNGKIIVYNSTGDKYVLSIPQGIAESKLMSLFSNNLEHIEFHIPSGKGILIDKYFGSYGTEMRYWYGNYRLEKAIKNKLIIWDDGAFIELNNNIIPWVNENTSILALKNIFVAEGNSDKERVQSIVDNFVYAGGGNIIFKFVTNNREKNIELNLHRPKMTSSYYDKKEDAYIIITDVNGKLFLTSNPDEEDIDFVINKSDRIINSKRNKIKID